MSDTDDQNKPAAPPAPKDGVAPELIQKLHEAGEKLGNARKHYEGALNTDNEGTRAREQASHEAEDAAGELEKVDEKIKEELKKTQP